LLAAQSDSEVYDLKWKSFTKAEIASQGGKILGTGLILGAASLLFGPAVVGMISAGKIKNEAK
jgi:hypothetical protein